jgi:hypothetical protein
MRRSTFTILFVLGVAHCCAAQSADSSQQPPRAAEQPAPAPPATPAAGPNSSAKKPKKVWTNEDLPEARGSVSVVGDPKNAGKPGGQSGKAADPGYVANVKKQLEKLQGQLADADKQIAKLKEFSAGEPVGTNERQFHKGYNSEPIERQVQTLEAKKVQTQAKIDALLDEARKKGVEPGQLR